MSKISLENEFNIKELDRLKELGYPECSATPLTVEEIKNFWGSNPIHALQLKSGKVLVTYGYRREPYSVRARL